MSTTMLVLLSSIKMLALTAVDHHGHMLSTPMLTQLSDTGFAQLCITSFALLCITGCALHLWRLH